MAMHAMPAALTATLTGSQAAAFKKYVRQHELLQTLVEKHGNDPQAFWPTFHTLMQNDIRTDDTKYWHRVQFRFLTKREERSTKKQKLET